MNKNCIILLADRPYFPGAQCLLHSLNKHNDLNGVDTILLTDESDIEEPPFEGIDRVIKINVDEYKNIKCRNHDRYIKAYYKYEAFQDLGYHRNIFIDSDMLCLGDIDLLLEPSNFNVAFMPNLIEDNEAAIVNGHEEVNTGVFYINVHKRDYGNLNKHSLIRYAEIHESDHDQDLINMYMRDKGMGYGRLPRSYNYITEKTHFGYDTGHFMFYTRIFHYMHEKPWTQEEGINYINDLWWRHYKEIEDRIVIC